LTHLGGIAAQILAWDEAVLEKEIQSCAKKWLSLQ
jgi:hypothetical protein